MALTRMAPTFCRGWGTLPFDRSTPEITAHALAACLRWWLYLSRTERSLLTRASLAQQRALRYLQKTSGSPASSGEVGGGWIPLWFGNEHTPDEENMVFCSAKVLNYALAMLGPSLFEVGRMTPRPSGTVIGFFHAVERQLFAALQLLLEYQNTDGGWGGGLNSPSSIEETAVTVEAISRLSHCSLWPQWVEPDLQRRAVSAVGQGATWLVNATQNGTQFPAAPIGLYFARLWYHERLYPVVWTLGALEAARRVRDVA